MSQSPLPLSKLLEMSRGFAALLMAATACTGTVGPGEPAAPDEVVVGGPGMDRNSQPPLTGNPGRSGASEMPAGPGSGNSAIPSPNPEAVGPMRTPEIEPNTLAQASLFQCDPAKNPAGSTARVWRLTNAQWINTFFPGDGKTMRELRADRSPLSLAGAGTRFSNYASTGDMDGPTLDALYPVAMDWARFHLAADKRACLTDASPPTKACFHSVVAPRVAQAYRRPATTEEVDRYLTRIIESAPMVGKSNAALSALASIMMAPEALFRWEIGEGEKDARGRLALSSWEMANALSFALRDSPPDAQLQAAATANRLRTVEEIRTEVLRLLGPADIANPMLFRFLDEYLQYSRAETTFKDPQHSEAAKKGLLASGVPAAVATGLLSGPHQVKQTDEWVKTLMGGPNLMSNLLVGRMGKTPEARAGLLTDRSFLIAFSEAEENDPIRRGKFITESLLCNTLPPIPLDVVPAIPEDKKRTLRERLAVHNADARCAGCHRFLDGIGLALEGLDDFGSLRTMEAGRPVETRANLVGAEDQDGPVGDALELSRRLAASGRVRQCFIRHSFRYWQGRAETQQDACALKAIDEAYGAKGSLADAVAAHLVSDSFRLRFAEKEVTK